MSKAKIMDAQVIGEKVALGSSNFAKVINTGVLYTDKSLFIREIIEDRSESILITRPRRWGKTLNMSMLQHFFAANVNMEDTNGLFDDLLISKVDAGKYVQYQGKYPVMMISMKGVQSETFADAVMGMGLLINSLCREHRYLKDSSKLDQDEKESYNLLLNRGLAQKNIEESLGLLSELLHKHYGQKVYILVDEYDTPINSAYQYGYLESMILLMKNMLGNALKDNASLEKGIMTGILQVSKNSMLSDLNNLKTYTILHSKYKEYFGFTNPELDLLFKRCKLERDEAKVKYWFNDYQIGGLSLYNPWSIMSCLGEGGELKSYWVNTGNDSVIKNLLQNANAEIQDQFERLMQGHEISSNTSDEVRFDHLENDPAALFSMLLYTGYLTTTKAIPDGIRYICNLRIPNKEIMSLYTEIFVTWLGGDSYNKKVKTLSILRHLMYGDMDRFAFEIEHLLLSVASIRDYAKAPESFYHGFMLALTAALLDEYYIESNKESGYGYPDLIFIPKEAVAKKDNLTKAVILEFKETKDKAKTKSLAHKALEQIESKNYINIIKRYSYIEEVLKVGLVFNGKEVDYVFNIEKLF